MTQHQSFPITPRDFRTLEEKNGINQDKFCHYCDGTLETSGKSIFAAGIFYICKECGKQFKKTKYVDIAKGLSYFQLVEIKGTCF